MTRRVIIEAVPQPGLSAERVRQVAAAHPAVLAHLETADADRLILGRAVDLSREPGERAPFRASVFDPVSNRGVELRGTLDRPEQAEVLPSAYRPNPRPEELRAAAAILRADERFPAGDDVVVYQPMPPLADLENPDGTTVRRPTLGVYTPGGDVRHRIVAVDVTARTVDWSPAGVGVAMHPGDCESHLPAPVESLRDRGGPDAVRLRVLDGGAELWNLVVVRPRASAPQDPGDGSGVELREVRYRGRLVFRQAHVPILNVQYEEDGVTFRDWQNQETRFSATGTDPVGWGWRICDRAPKTILERPDNDAGDFQGVAFHDHGGELRIVSEIAAGWYRYVSEWRLADDGAVRPRFGFAGVRNPRTCMRHRHHVYWRFDFDVEGSDNDVIEQFDGAADAPVGTPIVRETSRRRRPPARFWQVTDKSSGRGYRIVPGGHDNTTDPYGISDLWFLRRRASELYDGNPDGDNRAMLDRFVNGESVSGTNVVVWYAGHFRHDQNAPHPHQGHIVGPDLVPVP
ncbi:hypothetical protein [Planomonospora venezuelensis]|uniref:Copper amine oxidase, enzyme domain n=1 Tax=Planomonospora venezuelensis TaxID=1999 RepID=A0A841DLA8_PLAVE|nr:hypothetical protein [Planomonospora venezuelensis]MBB5967896.1 hypothetical protein [Planomonospora venezuelensis]GIN05533.1 hypothetical protein Pve01_71910 [Planomonospora venezuelensis]